MFNVFAATTSETLSPMARSVIIKVIFNLRSQYFSNIYIHSEA